MLPFYSHGNPKTVLFFHHVGSRDQILLDIVSSQYLLKWKFQVSLETQLCHVMFFWKLSYERMFCWSRHVRGEDVWLRPMLERTCDVWKEYKYTWIDSEWGSCIGLPCNTLLVFTDLHLLWLYREKCPKEFLVVFQLIFSRWALANLAVS